MKSLFQPDGRWLAPWDQAPAWARQGAVATVMSPPGQPARNDGFGLRNLAFQAQMGTLEEGAVDLDVGIEVLGRTNAPHGLAVPVLVHVAYDERIPGASASSQARARRLAAAIEARYAGAAGPAGLVTQSVVRARGRSRLEVVEAEGEGSPSSLPSGARPKEAQR